MTTIEVEIPKEIEKSFLTGKKRMSYDSFLKKAEEVEEAQWLDVVFDEPVPMEEFNEYLKSKING